MHKLWFTNIGLSSGKPISFMSNFLNSFFAFSTFWQSFRRENLTIMLSFFLLIRWQVSILFPSIGQPTFSNIFKTFPSKLPSLTLWGTPTNPKHSHLDYWALAQHWRSMETSLSENAEFICLAIVQIKVFQNFRKSYVFDPKFRCWQHPFWSVGTAVLK